MLKDVTKNELGKKIKELSQFQAFPKNFESIHAHHRQYLGWSETVAELALAITTKKPIRKLAPSVMRYLLIGLIATLTIYGGLKLIDSCSHLFKF